MYFFDSDSLHFSRRDSLSPGTHDSDLKTLQRTFPDPYHRVFSFYLRRTTRVYWSSPSQCPTPVTSLMGEEGHGN